MSYENPYAPPQADVSDPAIDVADKLRESPRRRPIGHGWSWLSEAFQLFKTAPGIWIANIILMLVMFIVIGLIPIAGSIVPSLLGMVITGGLMLGCHALDRGDELQVEHLFAGFKHRFGALMGLGLIYVLGLVVAFVVGFMATGADPELLNAAESGALSPDQMGQVGLTFVLAILIGLALLIPLLMAIWFSPALLVQHEELGLFQAMKLSFIGCLKNILPLLWYGIILLLLAVVATVPLALGWLVLFPMMYGSLYAGYKDIFLE